MAKAIVEVADSANGEVKVTVSFDPPLTKETGFTLSRAQSVAMYVVERISGSKLTERDDVEEES